MQVFWSEELRNDFLAEGRSFTFVYYPDGTDLWTAERRCPFSFCFKWDWGMKRGAVVWDSRAWDLLWVFFLQSWKCYLNFLNFLILSDCLSRMASRVYIIVDSERSLSAFYQSFPHRLPHPPEMFAQQRRGQDVISKHDSKCSAAVTVRRAWMFGPSLIFVSFTSLFWVFNEEAVRGPLLSSGLGISLASSASCQILLRLDWHQNVVLESGLTTVSLWEKHQLFFYWVYSLGSHWPRSVSGNYLWLVYACPIYV